VRPAIRSKRSLPLLSILSGVAVWWGVAAISSPLEVPSPRLTYDAAVDLVRSGVLLDDVRVTVMRVLSGFVAGSIVGIALGLPMGQFPRVRRVLEPYVETVRFVTPVALLGLIVVVFGLSETGKIFLIAYASVFIVLLNTMIGVLHVPEVAVRAARSLGASERQLFMRVTVPATIPYIFTGLRIALGNAFMTVVAAEMIFANSGVGYLIGVSRQNFRADNVFVGILTLGILGFASDRLLRFLGRFWGGRYGIRV
jgi:ABC-type nitrate/sulfonate/bicarbonate transport system permease component